VVSGPWWWSKGGRRATEAAVDKEVVQMLRDSHARATRLLSKHSADLHALSAELLGRETLTGDEIRVVLRLAPKLKPVAPPPKKAEEVLAAEVAAAAAAEAAAEADDGNVPVVGQSIIACHFIDSMLDLRFLS